MRGYVILVQGCHDQAGQPRSPFATRTQTEVVEVDSIHRSRRSRATNSATVMNPKETSGVPHRLCEDPGLATLFVDRGRVPLKAFSNALQVYEVSWGEG